jgi:hypothetical protein
MIDRTRSADASDWVVVTVSNVVNFSGKATVTNSEACRRHESENETKRMKRMTSDLRNA